MYIAGCILEKVTPPINEFTDTFCEKLQELIPHSFIAKQQSNFFKSTKEKLKTGEFVVVCDFSENYTFITQDAVQSAYYSSDQCTLHPFAIYYMDGNELKEKSLLVISSCKKHDTIAVYQFQTKLLHFLRSEFESVKKITFFSDGAAAQYKNRKNFYNICLFQKEFDVKVEWHFFATSHGKSACDGIGGAFKRLARAASLQKKSQERISTALELYEWSMKRKSTMSFVYCTKDEYNEEAKKHETRYDNVNLVVGTRSFHSFIPIDDKTMKIKRFSASKESKIVKIIG